MAPSTAPPVLSCSFCGKPAHNLGSLVKHLDACHAGWVEAVMRRIGLDPPKAYPVAEYRRELARASRLLLTSAGD